MKITFKKMIVISVALFLLAVATSLAFILLTSIPDSYENLCRSPQVLKLLTPITLGKETPITYVFKNGQLYAIIMNDKYIVAISENNRDVIIANNELWGLFESYCITVVSREHHNMALLYSILIIILSLISIVIIYFVARD